MDNVKDDRYYAKKILYYVKGALSCAKRIDFSNPDANEEGIFAINFCGGTLVVITISELTISGYLTIQETSKSITKIVKNYHRTPTD